MEYGVPCLGQASTLLVQDSGLLCAPGGHKSKLEGDIRTQAAEREAQGQTSEGR